MPDYYKHALDYRADHASDFELDPVAAMEAARRYAKESYGDDFDTKFLMWLSQILSRAADLNEKISKRKEGPSAESHSGLPGLLVATEQRSRAA